MKILKAAALLLLLAFFLAFPLLSPDPAYTYIAVFTLLFAGAAASWNIFSGYTGYISLGHTAFYGIGAYALGIMCKAWNIQGGYTPFLLLPLAGLIAGLCAIPLGWVVLRTRRHVFVVITIAMFYILQLLAYNLETITNGSAGYYLPNPPWDGSFINTPFYYVALALLLLALAVSWWVRHSKYGLGLLAIRDDEDRARGLGVKTEPYKLSAFVIAAVFAGMAGGLYAYLVGIISPSTVFSPVYDVTVALMSLLGGLGTLAGPILGALLLEPLQLEITIQFGGNVLGLDLVVYGALLLAIILLLPEGIIPTVRRRWSKWRNIVKEGAELVEITGQGKPTLVENQEGTNP